MRWDASCRAAAFPMRDGAGDVIGIRYRDLKTGKKWALRGSHNGLFIVPEYIPVECDEIVVCEGPTDTLAAVSCGMYAIGRACCQGGADHIREYLRRHRAGTAEGLTLSTPVVSICKYAGTFLIYTAVRACREVILNLPPPQRRC